MADADRVDATLDLGGRALDVLSYTLEEGLSQLDSCVVLATTRAADLPTPAALLGQPAELTITRGRDGQTRRVFGDAVSVSLFIEQSSSDVLRIEIAPRAWRLRARSNCRGFRQQSIPEIVQLVFAQAGIPSDEQSWELKASYPKREYVAQYRESDWEFVLRLLAEEGIYFLCEVREGTGTWVFSDDGHGIGPGETPELRFLQDFGGRWLGDNAFNLEQRHSLCSDKVSLRDYDFRHPGADLTVSSEAESGGALEIYRYPGRYAEPARGEKLAKLLLDAVRTERCVVTGETSAVNLRPGYRVRIEGHPLETLNQEYLVISTRTGGEDTQHFGADLGTPGAAQAQYECRFEAVAIASTEYRPARRAAALSLPGLQTAISTGSSGEEIFTNAEGQVTAKFHWDRHATADENASCWMRTSQVPTGGSMLLPRVGWELVVAYREGDVDQPLVLARLYNGKTPPPYSLPENAATMALQTATTPGGGSSNELRMSDVKGKEQMFFNASRDMSIEVGNNATETIGNNHSVKVGSNQTVTIIDSYANAASVDHDVTVSGNQELSATTLMIEGVGGDHSFNVGGTRTHMIGGDHRHTVEAGSSHWQVGATELSLVLGEVHDKTLANMSHEVGAALVEFAGGDRSVVVGGALTETTGAIKAIVCKGARSVEAPMMKSMVGGALITNIKGKRVDKAAGPYSETAAGAQIVKATNILFEAKLGLNVAMGGATLTLTPASVSIAGASITLQGSLHECGMVIDN